MVDNQNITQALPSAIHADPLQIAINTYRDIYASHNALPDDVDDDTLDASADTLSNANAVLANWSLPARTQQTALEALKLAKTEMLAGGELVAFAMSNAAVAFWETMEPQGAQKPAQSMPTITDADKNLNLTTEETAAYLRVTLPTLARWRSEKCGPMYMKSGGRVLYRVADILAFLADRQRKGTRPSA
ncbi:helix-turn-helix domain-containing protein [Rhizobium sp. 16-449-1b]|uniref:helix-turn-helix domain-containing protein n=1 Tax=Rhizobium sp. 16-449-1b TaxID=2819989 RepID=UPI001ADC636D|nr:helix-turn-helix domain-containing protein [Rhizobium sp. 16-449-1b]MBO9195684.1 helix-turn-helix domain-containing protein [Rhizobium sp. 16-449-1b]